MSQVQVRWAQIQQKPIEFPPLEHPVNKVTGLQGALDARELVANRNQPNGYPGLGPDAKVPAARLPFGTAAGTCCEGHDPRLSDPRSPLAHGHPQSDIAGLVVDLAGKAAVGHAHAQADVAGLLAALAARPPWVLRRTTQDYPRTLTTLADIPELDFPGAADTDYSFILLLVFQSAATATGVALSMNGPAAPAGRAPVWESGIQLTGGPSTSALQVKAQGVADALHTTASVDAANAARVARFFGAWPVGAIGGPIRPRFASEVAGSTVTIKRGSWLLAF